MPYDVHDTIVAIATPLAGAGRGVVRFSGPLAIEILERIFRPAPGHEHWQAVRRSAAFSGHVSLNERLGEVDADALIWPTSRSYTRQPTVELHTFGSVPILEAIVEAVTRSGARVAEPGEFTLRAFLAGRLDLTQAEAVLGVIDARNQQSLDTALAQLSGGLAGPLASIRGGLLDLLAHLEAGLDFVDDDIEFITAAELQAELSRAAESIAQLAVQMESRSTADSLFRVAILGWPNVGKSSLLNALAGNEAALVSPTAGATRDYVACRLEHDGFRYDLIDTAGVRTALDLDLLERSAQIVTRHQMETSHVQLLCLDTTRPPNSWELAQLAAPSDSRIVVGTKHDQQLPSAPLPWPSHTNAIPVSSVTGFGLDRLRTEISQCLARCDTESSVVAGTAARCRESLAQAANALDLALEASRQNLGEELVAADLRIALEEIGKVAGVVYTDDVLDRVFSRFCIGK